MSFDQEKIELLYKLKIMCKKDNQLFSDAVNFMQMGVNERIEELKKHAMRAECIAVAMHAKANDKRHTETQKKWVDGVIRKNSDIEKRFFDGNFDIDNN